MVAVWVVLFKRDKTFFFGDYEGFRLIKEQNPTQTTVPTAFERANPGNFTDNPSINRVVDPTTFDKAGLQYFNLFPLPTSTGVTQQLHGRPVLCAERHHGGRSRLDHNFRDGDLFFVRYTYNAVSTTIGGLFPTVSAAGLSVSPGGNLGSYPGPAFSNAHQAQLNYVHTFTPTTLLELKAG